jgi:DNA-directed RNA polymerase subunit beta'
MGSFNNVIVAEIAGAIKFEHIIDSVTYREESDEQTGHREKVVIETKDKTKIPGLIVEGAKDTKMYNLPVGSHIVLDEGEEVKPGQVLVKIPRVLGKLRGYYGRSSKSN